MNISILNFENSPFCFQPRFVQMVFPIEGLNWLFTDDSFIDHHFFGLNVAASMVRFSFETNHVQGLVSGQKRSLEQGWISGQEPSEGFFAVIDGAEEAFKKGGAPKG